MYRMEFGIRVLFSDCLLSLQKQKHYFGLLSARAEAVNSWMLNSSVCIFPVLCSNLSILCKTISSLDLLECISSSRLFFWTISFCALASPIPRSSCWLFFVCSNWLFNSANFCDDVSCNFVESSNASKFVCFRISIYLFVRLVLFHCLSVGLCWYC